MAEITKSRLKTALATTKTKHKQKATTQQLKPEQGWQQQQQQK